MNSLIIGRRELGKTTLVVYMARRCGCRIIFDPRDLLDVPARGERVRTVDDFYDAWTDVTNGTLDELIVTPDDRPQEMFDRVANRIKIAVPTMPGSLMFVIDEARFVSLMDASGFEWLLRAAPRDRVHIAITCHRPTDIPVDVRAIADTWILFQCTQEHDLKVIDQRCGERVRTLVSQLGPREFVEWDDAKGTYRVFRDPRAWFVPLRTGPAASVVPMLPAGDKDVDSEDRLF